MSPLRMFKECPRSEETKYTIKVILTISLIIATHYATQSASLFSRILLAA